MASLNIFRNNARNFGDCYIYNRYFIIFLRNQQYIFLPTKDNKWYRHLTTFTLKLSHRVTDRFTAAVLTSNQSIIKKFHPDLSNLNIFMNTSSEYAVPSPSGDSSYILQPAGNFISIHFYSSMIRMLMDLALKLYGEASIVIPNSLTLLSNFLYLRYQGYMYIFEVILCCVEMVKIFHWLTMYMKEVLNELDFIAWNLAVR